MRRAIRFALAGVGVLALGGLLVFGHGADATMGAKNTSPAKRAEVSPNETPSKSVRGEPVEPQATAHFDSSVPYPSPSTSSGRTERFNQRFPDEKPPQPVAAATRKVESSETVKESSLRIDAAAGTDLFAAKSWYVPPPPPPPLPPPKPVAPPFPYVYGGAQRDGDNITLFLQLGERNVIVRQGETLDGAYRLDEIANGEAVFTYLPLNEQQRLAIGNLN